MKVVAFGKAVLEMLVSLETLLGGHITDGIASVPVGAVEAAQRTDLPHSVSREGSRVR